MSQYLSKAAEHLHKLVNVKPNRRTFSTGNREATDYCANIMCQLGWAVETEPFEGLDYKRDKVSLSSSTKSYEIYGSPYSLGCDIKTNLVVVSKVEELEKTSCDGKILLMRGSICSEQLMPKNFVFYNPDNHKHIYQLLEAKRPSAIITATSKNPELVGALNPFPLIVDGDFDIPSVYCTEKVGNQILKAQGDQFRLIIEAKRIPARACNVIARKGPRNGPKIVVCAHIDAYEDAPGASDNASGVVVLLLLAELLAKYNGNECIEIIAFNGEDHYSVGGQMDYLKRYEAEFNKVSFVCNIDDVGYVKGGTSISFLGCSGAFERKILSKVSEFKGISKGEPWYQGDHMIFVQKEISAIAFTSSEMSELMSKITHTNKDVPEIVEVSKLVELAKAINRLIQ